MPAAAGRRDDLTILNGRRVRFGHIQRKNILNFAFVAACGPLQTHFHGRGRDGKQLPFIFTNSLEHKYKNPIPLMMRRAEAERIPNRPSPLAPEPPGAI